MDTRVERLYQSILQDCARGHSALRSVVRRQLQPSIRLRVIALLIWVLSRNIFWAISFLQRYPAHHPLLDTFQADSSRAVLTFLGWLQDDAIYGLLLACIESVEHKLRRTADVFLMESLLVQLISWQNLRGLTLDLHQAVNLYVRLWSHRHVAGATRQWLHRLVWHRHTRRRWGVLLRRNWILTTTILPYGRELLPESIRDKVSM